jgi:hypothetical protein
MGLADRTRATMGALRTLPDVHRRLNRLEAQLTEVDQRSLALAHQVDHLHRLLEQVDPQGTHNIVVGVRDSVRELAIELTEQSNLTSELLAELSAPPD